MRDYAGAAACDLDAHARLVPRAARARRLPAAVAVRGLVPVAGPHERARRRARSRPPPRRSRRSAERAARRSRSPRCAEPTAACSPARPPSRRRRRRRARRRRGGRRAAARPRGRVRAAGRGDPRGLPAHYGDGRVSCAPTTRTSRCSPATASTRSGWSAWPRSATSRPSPSWPTSSRLRAGARRGPPRDGRGGVGSRSRARRRRGRRRVTRPTKRLARGAASRAPSWPPRSRSDELFFAVLTGCRGRPSARRPSRKYTADRNIPGAFEGETVTRRRFMVGTAHAAGAVAALGFMLPGARASPLGPPLFERPEIRWRPSAPPTTSRRHLRAEGRSRSSQGVGEIGKTTVYVRRCNPDIDDRAAERSRRRAVRRDLHAAACTWAAPSATSTPRSASSARATAASTTSRARSPAARRSARSTASTPACATASSRSARATRSTASSSASRLPRSRAGPGRHRPVPVPRPLLDPEAVGTTCQAPSSPPRRSRRRSSRRRDAPGRRQAAQAARAGQGGRDLRRRLGRRAHVAVRRPALDDVPQGPQGHQLVLHAGLGDDVRLPVAGRHRRVPGDVLRPVADAAPTSRRATSPTRSSSASSCAACTSGARP